MDDIQLTEEEAKAMQEYFKTLIKHPFVQSEDEYPVTMAMVISEGRMYVGGISGIQDDMQVLMYSPLVFNEGVVRDPQTGEIHQQIAIMPLSFAVALADKVLLRASMIYQFKSKSDMDQSTVSQYARKWEEIRAAQAGIERPSPQDVSNLSKSLEFGGGSR